MFKIRFHVLIICCFTAIQTWAVRPDQKNLPVGLTPEEAQIMNARGEQRMEAGEAPPPGMIHSLGEWEEASEVMTLWSNPSYIKALSDHGKVRLLADSASEKTWWQDWLTKQNQQILTSQFSYFIVQTDSIWIRDYGPWPIVDSNGQLGLVDTIYNRPRPMDDKVPDFIGQAMHLPVYKIGLVHTGGNYYSDGLGNAFSSTLVMTENSKLAAQEILQRMLNFLGIESYVTSPLSPKKTIEHLDTFGKLVAPDTWVFSQFPTSSPHYADSEKMVALLKTKTSPYGTPYKIFRLKMTPINSGYSENYRAYLNSFISNGALFFPTYGDNVDEIVKATYQQALPGYKIIGVNNQGTEWGDSVHCRTRNLMNPNTIFIFPHVDAATLVEGQRVHVTAQIYASPGAQLTNANILWRADNEASETVQLTMTGPNQYEGWIPQQKRGTNLSFYIKADDSSGRVKTAPIKAPQMEIQATIQ